MIPALFRLLLALAVLAALFPAPAAAGDGIGAINDVWRDFVAAVRRGDYDAAHNLFSDQSRAVFPLPAFRSEYGPLSAARETLLAEPSSLSTDISGDWGEIRFMVRFPATGRNLWVAVAFVRNDAAWSLVAARNETRERLEAGIRGALRRLAPLVADPNSGARALEAAVRELAGPLAQAYAVEVVSGTLLARPRLAGLRTFHIDSWGHIRQGPGVPGSGQLRDLAAPVREISVRSGREVPEFQGVPAPIIAGPGGLDAPPPALPDPASPFPGMGELPDPGMAGGRGGPLPELPDPVDEGMRPVPPAWQSANEPSYLDLPDRIE